MDIARAANDPITDARVSRRAGVRDEEVRGILEELKATRDRSRERRADGGTRSLPVRASRIAALCRVPIAAESAHYRPPTLLNLAPRESSRRVQANPTHSTARQTKPLGIVGCTVYIRYCYVNQREEVHVCE